MPISWNPETHETLLVAIVKSSGPLNPQAIIAAWPAHKGPPPSLSALTQHITGLKKKVNASSGSGDAGHAATPAPHSRTKKAATGTFGSTPKSRGQLGKNTMFSGPAAKATRAANDSDDSEGGEEGDTCASTASPAPATLGKRARKQQEEDSEDAPTDVKKGNAFFDQLRVAASEDKGSVKQEPAWSSGGMKKKVKTEGKF
ncbi:hypothetical protein EG327_010582 [Venturia inaequalis]|uniref:Uncharacterized protein n=1 Tax=Venturia inaequalis TaxID=5025 RepID=A0A8H3VMG6_VENIN|nr:hypothetical protein EG327_010582 [Venturia inaequalis]